MRNALICVSVAAVVATAACNSGGGGEAAGNGTGGNEQRNEAVANVAAGQGTQQDHSAIMEARHEHYEEMGRAMKGISDQMKAGSPDVSVIQRHAALIAGYGPQVLGWFPEGSGPETGRRTRAKAEIWSDSATFRTASQRFEQASAEFNRAAQSGNVEAIRSALPALRESCSNCHDRFRGPEHD
jgi:cytochrome c556